MCRTNLGQEKAWIRFREVLYYTFHVSNGVKMSLTSLLIHNLKKGISPKNMQYSSNHLFVVPLSLIKRTHVNVSVLIHLRDVS